MYISNIYFFLCVCVCVCLYSYVECLEGMVERKIFSDKTSELTNVMSRPTVQETTESD
jgi:hypothetical protein